ncbi:LLM class flavin-dependent oxidoreductase [Nocardia ignorata]|uniref:LLM class flavin-dependent oxidoreductase n=1 Tax=Nocardia ignorata TaxID=145285 RepID=UPI00363DC4F6
MKLLLMTLITRVPDPVTGVVPSTRDRFREVVEQARRAEKFGFDGFAVGERHEDAHGGVDRTSTAGRIRNALGRETFAGADRSARDAAGRGGLRHVGTASSAHRRDPTFRDRLGLPRPVSRYAAGAAL